jgi:hypothetical protein
MTEDRGRISTAPASPMSICPFRGRERSERSPESMTTSSAIAMTPGTNYRLGLWIPVASGELERRMIVNTS